MPPAMWFHEHFNTSVRPVRFLAFHPPGMLAYPGWSGEGEHFIGKGPNQIEVRRRGSGDPKNIRVRARQERLGEPDAERDLREQESSDPTNTDSE